GALDGSKLRHGESSHIYPAFEILTEQIRMAFSYEGFRTATAVRGPEGAKQTALGLLSGIPRVRALLSKDLPAALQGGPAASRDEEVIFSYPSSDAITVYRIAHEL